MMRMRVWGLIALSLVLMVLVFIIKPDDFPVYLHKASLLTLGSLLGFWLDYLLERELSPERLVDINTDASWEVGEAVVLLGAMLRRSVFMIGSAVIFAWAI